MASLAAPDESPVRMSTYGVPLVRPVVPPLTEPRTHVHVRYARRVLLRRNRTFRIVSFMRVRVVSFMRLPADVPCIDSAQPAAT